MEMINRYKKDNIKKNLSKTLLKFSVLVDEKNEFTIKKLPSWVDKESLYSNFKYFEKLNFYRINDASHKETESLVSKIALCTELITFDFSSDDDMLLKNNLELNRIFSEIISDSQSIFLDTKKANKFIKKFSIYVLSFKKFNKESNWS